MDVEGGPPIPILWFTSIGLVFLLKNGNDIRNASPVGKPKKTNYEIFMHW